MPRPLWHGTLLEAQSGVNIAAALPPSVEKAENISIYVVFSVGTSAGVVMVEGAWDSAFAGTWANIGTISWAAANRAHVLNISGNHKNLRVRISTAIVGGTVSVYTLITG